MRSPNLQPAKQIFPSVSETGSHCVPSSSFQRHSYQRNATLMIKSKRSVVALQWKER
jgi:hypothetical protein